MIGEQTQDFRTLPFLWPEVRQQLVLDLGCGTGLYSMELARQGAICVGVDLSMENLRCGKEGSGMHRVHCVQADAALLPFRLSSFKAVISAEVITHFSPDSRQSALREIHRVGIDGAVVFLTLHNSDRLSLSQWLRLRPSCKVYKTPNLSVWPTSPAEAKTMTSQCGLMYSSGLRYLNYHSRFTHRFFVEHPLAARVLMFCEEVLSRLPGVRRLAITFLLPLANGPKE